jgi:hypothetical protein
MCFLQKSILASVGEAIEAISGPHDHKQTKISNFAYHDRGDCFSSCDKVNQGVLALLTVSEVYSRGRCSRAILAQHSELIEMQLSFS